MSYNSTRSDWPLALMYDEVWLQARRLLVHKLESAELWPDSEAHYALVSGFIEKGNQLKSEILLEVLGKEDYAHLGSESLFGPSNNSFRSKLPTVLSFGYELGYGLYSLVSENSESCSEVAKLCALFNLGISVFDLICDHFPELITELSSNFNEHILREIENDPEVIEELNTNIANIFSDELRILLKIILFFFLRIYSLSSKIKNNEAKEKLFLLLTKAYRKEMDSQKHKFGDKDDLISISSAKSILPFEVIESIALLFTNNDSVEEYRISIDKLVFNIGNIFWLTDDLVDIIPDFQAGALNSVLIQAGINIDDNWEPHENYQTFLNILEGNYIELTTDGICNNVKSMARILSSENFHTNAKDRFQNVILSYIRIWIS